MTNLQQLQNRLLDVVDETTDADIAAFRETLRGRAIAVFDERSDVVKLRVVAISKLSADEVREVFALPARAHMVAIHSAKSDIQFLNALRTVSDNPERYGV